MTKTQYSLSTGKDSLKYELEATLTKKVKEWLDLQSDIFYYKASDRFQKGISDIIACVSGVFVAIELKAASGTASPHQKLFIKEVEKANGIGGICYTVADVKSLVGIARNYKLRG